MKSLTDPSELLTLEHLSFSYGKKSVFTALNLTFQKGKFYCIVGPSGSGKSTLLYILGGFLRPSAGRYTFEGRGVYGLGEIGLGAFRKKNIGYLFQDFRLLPFLTVEQNIHFPVLFTGKRFDKEYAAALMMDLGIYHRRKAYPADISGGEAQRCALGRALIMRPKLLLLDEPTGNLDQKTELEILSVLQKLNADGLTLICVTHSPTIMKAADVVLTMDGHSLKATKDIAKINRAMVRRNKDAEK